MRKYRGLQQEANGITDGVIWKQLLIFFFPILLGTFFQQLYNTADAIIVGKFVGKEALSAVGGATGALINLIIGFFIGISSGATVIISQYYGARKDQSVSDAVHTAAALSLGAGVIITVVGIVFARPALRMMNTPDDVMDLAVTYMVIYFAGTIPSLIYNVGSGILRAIGDSKRPLYFLIAACMTNIVLDVVLVLGFNMGVAGAALATILSQAVSAVLVILTLLRSPQSFQIHPKKIRFHKKMLGDIMRIGLPAGLQSVMYSVSNIIIQAAINGFGTTVLAAWTAYSKMDGIVWMVINAFGISITTFVGQNFGAGLYDRVKKSVRICNVMTAATTMALGAILLVLGENILRMFATEPEVIAVGMQIVRILIPTYVTYILIEILSGALRGAGDSLIPTIITLTGVCLLRVVWIKVIVPFWPTVEMVSLSYPVTWVITSVMFLIYYCRGNWLKRCKLRQEKAVQA